MGVRIYGDNTNVVEKWVRIRVPVGAVVVNTADSALWRHNVNRRDAEAEWVTERMRGDFFGRGVALEDAGPCLLCEASVRVTLKVTPA